MKVAVAWATATAQDIVEIELPPGATVAHAVAQSGLVAHYGLDPGGIGFAIYGRRARPDALLADGDRVDLTRALEADPKAARAHRARRSPLAKPLRKRRPSG